MPYLTTALLVILVVLYAVDIVFTLLTPTPKPTTLQETSAVLRKETSLAYARGVEDARRCFYYDGAGLHDAMDQTGHMAATARASAGGDARLVEWVGLPEDTEGYDAGDETQEPSDPGKVYVLRPEDKDK